MELRVEITTYNTCSMNFTKGDSSLIPSKAICCFNMVLKISDMILSIQTQRFTLEPLEKNENLCFKEESFMRISKVIFCFYMVLKISCMIVVIYN